MAPRVIEYACAWWPFSCARIAMHDICLCCYAYDCLIVFWLLSDHNDYDTEWTVTVNHLVTMMIVHNGADDTANMRVRMVHYC